MNTENYCPLISCVCITRKRPLYLQRAIACFKVQSYPNKELLIVYDDDDMATAEVLEKEEDHSIVSLCVQSADNYKLGQLRNLSVQKSNGEFICQWDDDDWYHCGRLEFQYEMIKVSGKQGCLLANWIVYNEYNRTAYLSYKRLWEGSIMCKKDVMLQYPYAEISRGEDVEVIDHLYKNDLLFIIEDVLNLYIYTYHGKNTWDNDHFDRLINLSANLSKGDSNKIAAILNKKNIRQEDSLRLDKVLNLQIFN